jgi:hypothetical protein
VDITPQPSVGKRLAGRKGRGFDAAHVESATAQAAAEPTDTETPRQRGDRLLALCGTPEDVRDLQGSINEEIGIDGLGEWTAACEARCTELAGKKAA